MANNLMSSMHIRWWIFSCDLVSLYPSVHFLNVWLSDIIAITNSNGDSTSPRKISLRILTSAKLFPPTINCTLQFSLVFSINFMTSSNILYILRRFIIQLVHRYIVCFSVVNSRHIYVFPSRFAVLEDVLINV